MNDKKKQILRTLWRNPLTQQNETAGILQISRSRVVAHIMDLIRKGLIRGKGYILIEQDYCVVVGVINVDTRGVTNIRCSQAASHPGFVYCSTGSIGRNIAHSPALPGQDVHLMSAIGNDLYGETLPEGARRAGVNVSNCIHLHGHSTATYLVIASKQEEVVLATNNTHIPQQLTPQPLNTSRDLVRHVGVVLANYNLTSETLGWVFIIADETPMFIGTTSESKANKVKN